MEMKNFVDVFKKYWAVIIIWAVIGSLYYLPCIIFVGNKLGFAAVNTKKTIGVDIIFEANWFPIASSDTLLGKIFMSPEISSTVVYCDTNWVIPWSCNQVWVSRSNAWVINEESDMLAVVQQYQWGAVGIVKDEVTKTPSGKLGVIRDLGIGFSGESLDILSDIKAIDSTVEISEDGAD